MSDIFREVDEDIRHDRYKKLWDTYGPYLIGAAVLLVVATAGYRGFVYWQERQAQTSGDRFIAAIQAAEAGDHDLAVTLLEDLANSGSGGYPMLAGFRIAVERAALGDTAGAIAEYDEIADSRRFPSEIRNIARLRAALLLVDTATLEEMEARIGEFAATGNPWRHAARELLGMTAWRLGDYEAARPFFTGINVDQETPNDIRQRAQIMLDLIRARIGEADAGGS